VRVTEPEGHDLVREWRAAMQAVLSAAGSVAGRAELPRQLTAPMQRQAELLHEILERERRLQDEILGRAFAPIDAVFDLLEQSGAAFRQQSAALSESARALEQAAELMRTQAELYERTIRTLRRPSQIAKSAAGIKERPDQD
jgi:hypothetical protein